MMESFTILLVGISIFGGVWAVPACDPTPGDENLALKGKASQSTQYPFLGLPEYALNTKRDGSYLAKTCAHTNGDMNPWWKVDLGQSQPIGSIVVMNREDCCEGRLQGAEVRVGDDVNNNNPVCGTITDVSTGPVFTLCCRGMVGRYVSVVLPGRSEYLTLCGVEVYGVAPVVKAPSLCW